MVTEPRLLVPESSGLNGGDDQMTAMRFGPAAVSMRGTCNDTSFRKPSVPVSAGAGLLAIISTPNCSVPILTPAFRLKITGMLTLVPGAPDTPVADTVPWPCATREAGEINRTKRTALNMDKALPSLREVGGLQGRGWRASESKPTA